MSSHREKLSFTLLDLPPLAAGFWWKKKEKSLHRVLGTFGNGKISTYLDSRCPKIFVFCKTLEILYWVKKTHYFGIYSGEFIYCLVLLLLLWLLCFKFLVFLASSQEGSEKGKGKMTGWHVGVDKSNTTVMSIFLVWMIWEEVVCT